MVFSEPGVVRANVCLLVTERLAVMNTINIHLDIYNIMSGVLASLRRRAETRPGSTNTVGTFYLFFNNKAILVHDAAVFEVRVIFIIPGEIFTRLSAHLATMLIA